MRHLTPVIHSVVEFKFEFGLAISELRLLAIGLPPRRAETETTNSFGASQRRWSMNDECEGHVRQSSGLQV